MTRGRLTAVLLLGLFAAFVARAEDTVTLTSGERLLGEFVSANSDSVRLRIDGKLRTVARSEVSRIDLSSVEGAGADISRTKLVVETGLPIEVRLRSSLSSRVSRNGERFEAELLTNITSSSGEVLAEVGQTVWGRVVHAERRRPPAMLGTLDVELSEVRMVRRNRIIKTTFGQPVDEIATDGTAREKELEPGMVLRFRLSQPITIRTSRF